jgi:hypothetical protein
MTDRLCGFIVTLDRDIREDDAESTIAAIRHIKGVLSVMPYVQDFGLTVATERVRREIWAKLLEVVKEQK